MFRYRNSQPRLRWLASAAAAACLGLPAALHADAVEDLRRVLGEPERHAAVREARLKACLASLSELDDLRRALALHEWRDEQIDAGLAAVDRAARKIVADRFEQKARALLWQGDTATRLAVVQIVGEMGVTVREVASNRSLVRRLTPDLAELVGKGPPGVREAAAQTLGKIDPEPAQSVAALRALLEKGDTAGRTAAAQGLKNWLTTSNSLVQQARTFDGAVLSREELIQLSTAVLPTAGRGLSDVYPPVRRLCVATVGEVARSLIGLVPDPIADIDDKDRAGVQRRLEVERQELQPLLNVLNELGPSLAKVAADPDAKVCLETRRALEDLAAAQVRLQRRHAVSGPAGAVQRVGFTPGAVQDQDPLGNSLRPTVQALTAGINDADVRTRRAAVEAIEALGPAAPAAAPSLVKALGDSDRFVRWTAARSLGRLAPVVAETAVPELSKLLWDKDLDVSLTAAATLERYGTAAQLALPTLQQALSASDPELRVAVLRVMGVVGPTAAAGVTSISASLQDPDPRVRQMAAVVLGRLGTLATGSVEPLRRALTDSNADVRKAASAALVLIAAR